MSNEVKLLHRKLLTFLQCVTKVIGIFYLTESNDAICSIKYHY